MLVFVENISIFDQETLQKTNISMEKSTASRVSFSISAKFHQEAAREQMFAPNHLTLESKLNFSAFIPPRNGMELVGGSEKY